MRIISMIFCSIIIILTACAETADKTDVATIEKPQVEISQETKLPIATNSKKIEQTVKTQGQTPSDDSYAGSNTQSVDMSEIQKQIDALNKLNKDTAHAYNEKNDELMATAGIDLHNFWVEHRPKWVSAYLKLTPSTNDKTYLHDWIKAGDISHNWLKERANELHQKNPGNILFDKFYNEMNVPFEFTEIPPAIVYEPYDVKGPKIYYGGPCGLIEDQCRRYNECSDINKMIQDGLCY